MAGNILTPSAIWSGFKVNTPLGAELIEEKKRGDVVYSEISIEGRKVDDKSVEIYGVLAKNAQLSFSPAILVLNDFIGGVNTDLITDLAKKGYTVLAVDLAGESEEGDRFTVYPESISYANYKNAKENLLSVEGDAKGTCWYEWACVARYALSFLKEQCGFSKVGAIAGGDAANALWQVAGTDELLDCAVFLLNAGWRGYRGIHKFGGKLEPQFDDNMYKFIAGLEPQAYAMHVKCPSLILSATNSSLYDCDRAYDTATRINGAYKAVHYSVSYRSRISNEGYNNAVFFFEEFLMRENSDKTTLPSEPDIKCDIVDGKLYFEVDVEEKDLKRVHVYVSEETTDPALRSWQRVSERKKIEEGKYAFNYAPYPKSGIITAFAKVTYTNGFSICSNIIAKRFNEDEVEPAFKANILYTSREEDLESVFGVASPDSLNGIVAVSDKKYIRIKKGPMGIVGISSEQGLVTFKIGAKRFMPTDGAMLMLDVYAKEKSVLTVKLISDYWGNKIEYLANVNILGGDVWHNVQLEMNRFKTAEGMVLKTYGKINAVEFNVNGVDYLINNVLWV